MTTSGPPSIRTARRVSTPAARRDEFRNAHGREPRRGQLRELRVGGREPAQGVGARRDHGEAALHVVVQIVRPAAVPGASRQHRFEAAGDRLDRRQRIVDLVADDADQSLPGLALLVAQRAADVGEHEQLMRTALLPERRAAHLPAAGRAGKRHVLDARRRALEARASTRVRRRSGRAAVRPACRAAVRRRG